VRRTPAMFRNTPRHERQQQTRRIRKRAPGIYNVTHDVVTAYLDTPRTATATAGNGRAVRTLHEHRPFKRTDVTVDARTEVNCARRRRRRRQDRGDRSRFTRPCRARAADRVSDSGQQEGTAAVGLSRSAVVLLHRCTGSASGRPPAVPSHTLPQRPEGRFSYGARTFQTRL